MFSWLDGEVNEKPCFRERLPCLEPKQKHDIFTDTEPQQNPCPFPAAACTAVDTSAKLCSALWSKNSNKIAVKVTYAASQWIS